MFRSPVPPVLKSGGQTQKEALGAQLERGGGTLLGSKPRKTAVHLEARLEQCRRFQKSSLRVDEIQKYPVCVHILKGELRTEQVWGRGCDN